MKMHFWRDSVFHTAAELAAEAHNCPEWTDYAAFCSSYERGLRREALGFLERFIAKMEGKGFTERKLFVHWLLTRVDQHGSSRPLMPYPLQHRLIKPTLMEWLQVEPSSAEPHRWLGGYDHLKRALELDPSDEITCRRFIHCILGEVEFRTHELPSGYLGEPDADWLLLMEAMSVLPVLPNESERNLFSAEIEAQKKLIENYLHQDC